MTRETAIEIATSTLTEKKRRMFPLVDAEFLSAVRGGFPRDEAWVVRFQKSKPISGSIDGGGQIIMVIVDPKTGEARKRRRGF